MRPSTSVADRRYASNIKLNVVRKLRNDSKEVKVATVELIAFVFTFIPKSKSSNYFKFSVVTVQLNSLPKDKN